MTAHPERDYLRLIKTPEDALSEAEVLERLDFGDLMRATGFDLPAPVYPIAVWRKAFLRRS